MKKIKPKQIVELLNEMKIEAVDIYDVRKISDTWDYALIAEAGSATQVKAAGDFLYTELKRNCLCPRYEGKNFGNPGWSVLDTGSLIIHILIKSKREYYMLDRIFEHAKKVKQ